MSVSQPFLELTPEDDAVWQARIAQGGCFVIAEASMNDAVPWLAERWGAAWIRRVCIGAKRGAFMPRYRPIASHFTSLTGRR
nr:hypothetical protein [Pectobacterium carotovorum]